ncbi:MAG: hypothetical protein HYW65_00695 [Candidatus Liptonbacteria bacterium]|nr:hypothetical protein [Candidatus Liptonbacteria bacterium]
MSKKELFSIAVAVLVVGGGAYWYSQYKTSYTEEKKSETNVQNVSPQSYSFKGLSKRVPERKWNDVFVEVYKNGELVRSVKVGEDEAKASQFTISPDGRYVAFAIGTAGGTCVYFEDPYAINLETFSVVAFTAEDPKERESWFPGKDWAATPIERIAWTSNNEVEATFRLGMKFGG